MLSRIFSPPLQQSYQCLLRSGWIYGEAPRRLRMLWLPHWRNSFWACCFPVPWDFHPTVLLRITARWSACGPTETWKQEQLTHPCFPYLTLLCPIKTVFFWLITVGPCCAYLAALFTTTKPLMPLTALHLLWRPPKFLCGGTNFKHHSGVQKDTSPWDLQLSNIYLKHPRSKD